MTEISTDDLPLDLIDVGPRLRKLKDAAVEAMMASMKERGQLTPIEVRPKPGGRFELTTGAHRIAAAGRMDWPTIRAEIKQCSDDEARLREIDENLYRAELTAYDQANFLEERRQIWERIQGQLKRGGDRRSKGQVVPLIDRVNARGSFFEDTAVQFGLHPRQIKRALTRKAHIDSKLWDALRDTEAADNGALLDKVRKLELDEQVEILRLLKERGCTVKHAIRAIVAPVEIDADERDLNAMRRAWSRATPAAREMFLSEIERAP